MIRDPNEVRTGWERRPPRSVIRTVFAIFWLVKSKEIAPIEQQ